MTKSFSNANAPVCLNQLANALHFSTINHTLTKETYVKNAELRLKIINMNGQDSRLIILNIFAKPFQCC